MAGQNLGTEESAFLRTRISAGFAALFVAHAINIAYWPVWLGAQGLTAAEIGLIVAIGHWMKPVTDPLTGMIVDRTGSRRGALFFASLLALVCVGSLVWFRSPSYIFAVSLIWTAAFATLMPVSDNLALLSARPRGLDYGRLRVWGSISFATTVTLAGPMLDSRDSDAILYTLMAGLATMAVVSLALPTAPETPNTATSRPGPWPLLRNRQFLLFLATAGLVQTSHGMLYAFGSLYWKELGISGGMIGLLWLEGVLVEILVFTFARSALCRFGAAHLLIAAALAGVFRWSLMGNVQGLEMLILAQGLHGISFGVAHLAAMRFLEEAVPHSHSATGQTLYTGLTLGGGYGLLTIIAGPLFTRFGGAAFLAPAAMCAASAALGLLLIRQWRTGKRLVIA